jgi:hypothetical protein
MTYGMPIAAGTAEFRYGRQSVVMRFGYGCSCMQTVRVQLIRKLANAIDGVDVAGRAVGDSFDVSPEDARLLIAERWAIAAEDAKSEDAATPFPAIPVPAEGF